MNEDSDDDADNKTSSGSDFSEEDGEDHEIDGNFFLLICKYAVCCAFFSYR